MKRIGTTLLLMCMSLTALANDLKLNGIGLYSDLRAKYYYGALYTEKQSSSPKELLADNGPKRLEMRILADRISKRRFYKLFNEAIAINNKNSVLAEYADEIVAFTNITKGRLKTGDTVVVDNSSGKTRISINDVELEVFDNPGFVNVLLRGWIGRLPPTTQFKENILGKTGELAQLQGDFLALVPAEGRKSSVQAWSKPKPVATVAAVAKPAPKVTAKPSGPTEAEKKAEADRKRKEQARIAALIKRQEEERKARDAERRRLAAIQKTETRYLKRAIRAAMQNTVYPAKAYKKGYEGYGRVRVMIDRTGKVLSVVPLQSTGHDMLDKASIKTVKKTEFEAVPAELDPDEESYEFTLPFRYAIAPEDKKKG